MLCLPIDRAVRRAAAALAVAALGLAAAAHAPDAHARGQGRAQADPAGQPDCARYPIPAGRAPGAHADAIVVAPQSLGTFAVPGFTIPAVDVPEQVIPADCARIATAPAGCLGAVTIPAVTVPGVSIPGIEIPPVDAPGAHAAGDTIAAVSVPAVTEAAVSTGEACARRDSDGTLRSVYQPGTYRSGAYRASAYRSSAYRSSACLGASCVPAFAVPAFAVDAAAVEAYAVAARTLSPVHVRELPDDRCAETLANGSQIAYFLCADALFAGRGSRLRSDAGARLRPLARSLRRLFPAGPVRVDGHTDRTGPADRNDRLSAARARAIARWLVTHGGVAAERVSAFGLGETMPIMPNASRAGRAANRRIAIGAGAA